MDPDQALHDLRNAIEDSYTRDYASAAWCRAAEAAIEHAASLDAWLTRGGFPPAGWSSISKDEKAPADTTAG